MYTPDFANLDHVSDTEAEYDELVLSSDSDEPGDHILFDPPSHSRTGPEVIPETKKPETTLQCPDSSPPDLGSTSRLDNGLHISSAWDSRNAKNIPSSPLSALDSGSSSDTNNALSLDDQKFRNAFPESTPARLASMFNPVQPSTFPDHDTERSPSGNDDPEVLDFTDSFRFASRVLESPGGSRMRDSSEPLIMISNTSSLNPTELYNGSQPTSRPSPQPILLTHSSNITSTPDLINENRSMLNENTGLSNEPALSFLFPLDGNTDSTTVQSLASDDHADNPQNEPNNASNIPSNAITTSQPSALTSGGSNSLSRTSNQRIPSPDDQASISLAQSLSAEALSPNKRRMRKRTIAQLYPYSIELASYKIQVRSHGIRPTRLVDLNDDIQDDPTVQFEERQHHQHHSHRDPQHINSESPISDRSTKHRTASGPGVQGLSMTQSHGSRRVIADSEDEQSDSEMNSSSRKHTRHNQQFYFSDTDDENGSQVQDPKLSFLPLRNPETWNPFNSDDDDYDSDMFESHAGPSGKGALPASFLPESTDLENLLVRDSAIEPTPHRKGVAIHKRGLEKHDVRREIPNNPNQIGDIQVSSRYPATQPNPGRRNFDDVEIHNNFDLTSDERDVEITGIREVSNRAGGIATKSNSLQEPSSTLHDYQMQRFFQDSPRQTDIRDYGDGQDGAEEHDVIDHMVSKSTRTRVSRGTSSRARKTVGGSKRRTVAVSQNPRRTTSNSIKDSRSSSNRKKPASQSMPAKRYHGSIIQNFVDNFQTGTGNTRSTLPGLSTDSHIPSIEEEKDVSKKPVKKRGPRPLAVVSGLHTPRNKPKMYSSVFQIESGSYVPRLPPKRPRKRPQINESMRSEYPVAAFENPIIDHSSTIFPEHPVTTPQSRTLNLLDLNIESRSTVANINSEYVPVMDQPQQPRESNLFPMPRIESANLVDSRPLQVESRILPLAPHTSERYLNFSELDQENYTFNFNSFPFPSSTIFEPTSFVGKGSFQKILKGDVDSNKIARGSGSGGYFGPDLGMIKWDLVSQEVVNTFKKCSKTIVRWISGSQDSITTEHTQSVYFYWSFVTEFFFDKLAFTTESINSTEIYNVQVLEIIDQTLTDIVNCLNSSSEKLPNWNELCLTSVAFLLTLLLPILRRNRASIPVPSRIFSEASTVLLKRLLSNFNEISEKVSRQRTISQGKRSRVSYISRESSSYLLEISYMCVHLMDAGADYCGGLSFLRVAQTCIKTSMSKASGIYQSEVIWQTLFLFNTFYFMQNPNHATPKAGWLVVNSLVLPVFESLKDITRIEYVDQSVANYAKALLARCLILLTTWKWKPDREIIKTVYSFFASIRYANFEPRDVGHELPNFLLNSSLNASYSFPSLDDTIFQLFLKLLAVCMKSYKKTSSRQLRRLVDSVNVLNNFTYPPRDAEIQVVELESLANQYSLLLTRYKFSSKTAQPPLEQLVGLFSLENSHLLARKLTVDAWKVVTEIQLNRNQSLSSVMNWYDQLLGKAFDEYMQLDKATGPVVLHLDNREIRRRKDHLETYEKFLFRPLQYLEKFLSNKDTLVKSTHWHSLLRKLFMKVLASDAREELRSAVLEILSNYISSALYMATAEKQTGGVHGLEEEDSQTLDFVLPAQHTERNEFVVHLAHYYSTTIQLHRYKEFLNELLVDTNTNSDSFMRKAIDLWASTARFLVHTKQQDWQVFYYSWQWFRKSKWRTIYEPYWLSVFIKECGSYYYEEETSMLQDMMKYLVCISPVYEQKYIAALFDKSPTIFQFCAQRFKHNLDKDFARSRLAIIQDVIKELGQLLQNPSTTETAKILLTTITNNMKSNSKDLDFKNDNGYMTFVRQVVDWIFQYCKDFNVDWFMDPTTFPAAALEEEHSTFKTAKFKKMLQIDFSNEYMAGYRLLHFFCLELQASAMNQDNKFTSVISGALVPELYGGVINDTNKAARNFLLKTFIKPYLIESINNQVARIFLNPVVDTVETIFKVQSEMGLIFDDVDSVLDIVTTLENFLWINLNKILVQNSSAVDYWYWKCATACFNIGRFLLDSYIEHPRTSSENVKSCINSLTDLAMYVVIYLICDLPRHMPDVSLTIYNPAYHAVPDYSNVSSMRFYKPIVSSFISQVTFNGLSKQWESKGLVANESSFSIRKEKKCAIDSICNFFQSLSLMSQKTSELPEYLCVNHMPMIHTLNKDPRSLFKYFRLLNLEYNSYGMIESIPGVGIIDPETLVANSSAYQLSSTIDDFIF